MKKRIIISLIAVIVLIGVIATVLYLWAAYLYRESPWSLPEWVEKWFEKDEDGPKPLHWYTKIDWKLDDESDIGEAPPIYGHSDGSAIWNLLVEQLGFEPTEYEPGLELKHPIKDGCRIEARNNGSIYYYPGVDYEDDNKTGLFGNAAYEKAVEILKDLGIDLTHYVYVGTSDALGDTDSLHQTLPDGTIEYASSDRYVYFDLEVDGYKFYSQYGLSLEVGFYYDQLLCIEFHNYMPIPSALSYGDGDITGPVSGKTIEKRMRKTGIYINREMESIKEVYVEDAHIYYNASLEGYYYEPYLEIIGHASDGYINAPFTAYVYALEEMDD